MSNVEQGILNDEGEGMSNVEQGISNDEVVRTEMLFDSGLFLGFWRDNDQFSIFNDQCSREGRMEPRRPLDQISSLTY